MIRRPLPVSILCVLGAVATLVTGVLFAVDAPWAVPPSGGQRALVFAALAVTATALGGLWRMRRWSVVLMAVLFTARLAYGLTGHLAWNLPALAGPAAILLVGLIYFRRMT
jgi:hypothetical protein